MKSSPSNLTHQGLSNCCPHIVWISVKKLILILLNFLSWNYSIFSNSCTIGLNIMKPPQSTSTHREWVWWKVSWFGRSQCDKKKTNQQNEQTTFLDTWMFILNNYCYFLGSIGGLLVVTLQKLQTQIPIHGFIQP